MKVRFLVHESIEALRSNLLRSLLTILGIVVGIFSVTAMLALGAGLSANVMERFNSFAQGDITVSGDIAYQDYEWIKNQPYAKSTLASLSVSGVSVVANGTEFSPTVQSLVGDYETIQQYDIVSGTTFAWDDVALSDSSVVVSDGFADTVQEETGQSIMGQTISLNGQPFTVIGVISSNVISFTRGDGVVLVPYGRAVGQLTSTKYFGSVAVVLKDSSYYEIAGTQILASLNASRYLSADSEDLFSVETAQSFIETAEETISMITLFLGIVGGIALFVGGIGTMNMMLTTVSERTKEIGLRKAVGARDKDILLQILFESVTLTSFGGALGIGLTLVVAKIANTIFADSEIISVVVNMQVVLLAALVAVIVGVVFGLYPARSAAKLEPVEALRSE